MSFGVQTDCRTVEVIRLYGEEAGVAALLDGDVAI